MLASGLDCFYWILRFAKRLVDAFFSISGRLLAALESGLAELVRLLDGLTAAIDAFLMAGFGATVRVSFLHWRTYTLYCLISPLRE